MSRKVQDGVIRIYRPGDVHEEVRELIPFKKLQELVGGYVQIVRVSEKLAIACDEDGKLKSYLPTLKVSTPLGSMMFCGTVVVGNFGNSGMKPVKESEFVKFDSIVERL